MPKLNEEILEEIFICLMKDRSLYNEETYQFHKYFRTKMYISLQNFMMAGREPLAEVVKWFNRQKIQHVSINGNTWIFSNLFEWIYSDKSSDVKCAKDWIFDNFVFIESISLAIVKNVKAVKIQNPTSKCFAFLGQLKYLKHLEIEVTTFNELRNILRSLHSLKTVHHFRLSFPNGSMKALDLIHFKVMKLICHNFMFEKKLKCKVRKDINQFEFFQDFFKFGFILKPQHFANYSEKLPNVSYLLFSVKQAITDSDTEALKVLNEEFAKEIRRKNDLLNFQHTFVIRIFYYKYETNLNKTFLDAYEKYALRQYKETHDYKRVAPHNQVFVTTYYRFNEKNYASNLWNPRILYTIPTEYQKFFKPKDFAIFQTMDFYRKITLFKFPLDLPFIVFKNFYAKHVGVPADNLRCVYFGHQIENEDTLRNIQRFKNNWHRNIIQIFTTKSAY